MKKIGQGILLVLLFFLIPTVPMLFSTRQRAEGANEKFIEGRTILVKIDGHIQENSLDDFVEMVLAQRWKEGDREALLQAESVMIRTDILRKMGERMQVDADSLELAYVTPIEQKKQWKSEANECMAYLQKCVEMTENKAMYYKEALIEARYMELSSGKTFDGTALGVQYGYLQSVECCEDMDSADYLKACIIDGKTLSVQLQKRFPDAGISKDKPMSSIQILERTGDGYVKKIQMGNVVLTNVALAQLLQLPSPTFTLEACDEGIRIITRGMGDGYGLSLFAANQMAAEGKTWEEILMRFYKGIQLKSYSTDF